MAQMKRVPANQLKKANEKMKQKPAVKITGSASTTPRVSNSMISSRPKTIASTKKPMPKIIGSKPGVKKPMRAPKYPGQPLAPGTTPNTLIRVQRSKPVTPKKPAVKVTKTPSRKNVIPPDYDVIIPGMGYTKPTKKSPPKKIKKK